MARLRRWFKRLYWVPLTGMREDPSGGLERLVRYFLLLLRVFSIQYWLIALFDEDDLTQRRRRDISVDVSVVVQFLVVMVLWYAASPSTLTLASGAAGYLLFVSYLSIANIMFFSGVPSINEPTTSPTRSLLLLAINVLQVTFSFALFYRTQLALSPREALFGSFLVLGTVGLPDGADITYPILVPLQILANFVLLAFAVNVFVGRVPLQFATRENSDSSDDTA